MSTIAEQLKQNRSTEDAHSRRHDADRRAERMRTLQEMVDRAVLALTDEINRGGTSDMMMVRWDDGERLKLSPIYWVTGLAEPPFVYTPSLESYKARPHGATLACTLSRGAHDDAAAKTTSRHDPSTSK